MTPRLNALDRLLVEAEQRRREAPADQKPIVPSTLPPSAIMGAHLTPLLRAAQTKMHGMLDDMGRKNDADMEEILRQRREIKELVARLEEHRRVFEQAVEEVQAAHRMDVDL